MSINPQWRSRRCKGQLATQGNYEGWPKLFQDQKTMECFHCACKRRSTYTVSSMEFYVAVWRRPSLQFWYARHGLIPGNNRRGFTPHGSFRFGRETTCGRCPAWRIRFTRPGDESSFMAPALRTLALYLARLPYSQLPCLGRGQRKSLTVSPPSRERATDQCSAMPIWPWVTRWCMSLAHHGSSRQRSRSLVARLNLDNGLDQPIAPKQTAIPAWAPTSLPCSSKCAGGCRALLGKSRNAWSSAGKFPRGHFGASTFCVDNVHGTSGILHRQMVLKRG